MKKVINRFSILLAHITLLKLSNVKIFPKAAVHTKNTTLKEALTLYILFQGKWELIRMDNT